MLLPAAVPDSATCCLERDPILPLFALVGILEKFIEPYGLATSPKFLAGCSLAPFLHLSRT